MGPGGGECGRLTILSLTNGNKLVGTIKTRHLPLGSFGSSKLEGNELSFAKFASISRPPFFNFTVYVMFPKMLGKFNFVAVMHVFCGHPWQTSSSTMQGSFVTVP